MSGQPVAGHRPPSAATSSSHIRLLPETPEPDVEPSALVSVSSLVAADSPRLHGVDVAHAEALAGVDGELPPILVQRSTMRVIDGMHRLSVALSRGQEKIRVQFSDCGEDEAFLLAVAANIKHGLPLTLADRRAAAERIIRIRPDASDRWIAEIAGLAAKTVAAIRRNAADSMPGLTRRVGRDGRIRPLNVAEGRRRATEILTSDPNASLQQIARDAGISVGTVRDVRKKLRQGLDPVAPKPRISPENGETASAKTSKADSEVDFDSILQRLRQDPSLRYTESGRAFLRWLRPPRLMESSDWEGIIDYIPPHCTFDVARIAHSCAATWGAFAEKLDRRNRDCG